MQIMTMVSTIAAALEPVMVYNTATHGWPVADSSAEERSPRLNMKVIIMVKPVM